MRRIITCEEWSKVHIGDKSNCELNSFSDVEEIFFSWRMDTGRDPDHYFELGSNYLVPKFWSGVLSTPHFTFEVQPIGSGKLNKEMLSRLDARMSLMLHSASLTSSAEARSTEMSQSGGRLNAILDSFCSNLIVARRRLILRRYVTNEASTAFPKGKIVFPRQFHETIKAPGRFYSKWISLSEDTPENRIFLEVLLRFKPRCCATVRSKIDFCLAEMGDVEKKHDWIMEWGKISISKAPDFYKDLLSQAVALLSEEGAGVFSGDTLATSKIMFTSRVFERYVTKEMAEVVPLFNYNLIAQERGVYLLADNKIKTFEIIPDIRVMDSQGRTNFIIDVKWKRLNLGSPSFGVSISDIYQVIAYCAKHECGDAILLFPSLEPETMSFFYSFNNESRLGCRIHVAALPMLSQNPDAFRDFLKEVLERVNG